ncbi:Hamartin protein-domain-containing protein [Syncephalis pseudoplumigaleata]|uniref:Hamartin protein-domain-containing protein n=1 Tax=Syncephalis pseudoplumigaleata TaxID=1712513 RepID=A0A4P9YYD0_9FUNG|nr:Hamartin protein-domain-containing protein [Syncephalis pseudoplumigaleata]|eukprot:RKP24351.1 Hamartin protein-domain-containing protein [Syncephalis pseudoplumigaleata]
MSQPSPSSTAPPPPPPSISMSGADPPDVPPLDDRDRKDEEVATTAAATSRKNSETASTTYTPELEAIQQLRKRLPPHLWTTPVVTTSSSTATATATGTSTAPTSMHMGPAGAGGASAPATGMMAASPSTSSTPSLSSAGTVSTPLDGTSVAEQWWQTTLLSILREERGLESAREAIHVLLQLLSPSPLAAEEDKLSISARDSLVMALLHVYRGDCAVASLAEEPGGRELKDNLEDVLIAYGGANAKAFFMAVYKYFIRAADRASMLDLLVTHARRQLDKSALVVTSGVSLLLMLMPRICTALSDMLPLLYWVCMRVLYWRPPSMEDELSSATGAHLGLHIVSVMVDEWDLAVDADADVRVPEAAPLFNILYGMFPCNTIAFLRSPTSYTKSVDCCFGKIMAKDEDELVRSEAMPLLRKHKLHPSLVLFADATEERQDASRWMDKEPADIVADCIGLQASMDPSEEEAPHMSSSVPNMIGETSWLEEEQVMLVRNQMLAENDQVPVLDVEAGEDASLTERWMPHEVDGASMPASTMHATSAREADATAAMAATGDTATVHSEEVSMCHSYSQGGYPAGTSVAASVRSILAAHRALTSGTLIGAEHWDAHMFEPVSVGGVAAMDPTTAAEVTTTEQIEQVIKTVHILQRKVLLLTNRLNYELFLKQQFMRHIGRLHRDRLMDSAVEAERQGLYNTCRALKNEIRLTKEAYERQRAEAATAKANHVNWQNELNNKLRMYRDERKRMQAEIMELQASLEQSMATVRNQETLLQERYSRVVAMEHQLSEQETLVTKASEYEQQLDQLSKELMLWREDTAKGEEQRKEAEHLRELWRHAEMRVDALEHELELARTHAIDHALQVNDLRNENERLLADLKRSRKSCQHQVQLWQDAQVNLKKRLKYAEKMYEVARHFNSDQEVNTYMHAYAHIANHSGQHRYCDGSVAY